MRLEELLGHRRRDPVAQPRRQRRQDHRRVHVALVVGGEDHRPAQIARGARGPRRASRRTTRASGRIQVGRLARRIGARRPATGSTTETRPARPAARRAVDGCSTSVRSCDEVARAGERALVDARLRTRPRARPSARPVRASSSPSSSSVVLGEQIGRGRRTARPARPARRSRPAPGAARRRSSPSRGSAARFSLRVPSVRGSSGSGQTSAAPNLLMIVELARWPAGRPRRRPCPGRAPARRAPAPRRPRRQRRRPPSRARRAAWFSDALDVLRKDVQPLRRDDHLLLAAADEQLAVGADLADVAGVEPAVLERARRFLGGVEVAGRDVLAAHENLAVGGDLHLDAGDRLADRALLGAERMVEA